MAHAKDAKDAKVVEAQVGETRSQSN